MRIPHRAGAAIVAAASLLTVGCPARIQRERSIVWDLTLRGVRQVDEGALRTRLVTRETPRWPLQRPTWMRWWRWWWVEPDYLDAAALTRDQARIQRFYASRGFFDAHASLPRVAPERNGVRIDIDVDEGAPTRVTDLRLRGCEGGDAAPLPEAVCAAVRPALTTLPGTVFDEDHLRFDRSLVFDALREAGFASPTVIPHAAVDPELHQAWVEFSAVPGPASRFGDIRILLSPDRTPFTGDRLPNGLPVSVIRSALGVRTGQRYSRSALALAQQALFDLGVFGIARIEESPRPGGIVDLDITLSTARLWRLRLGGGLEYDPVRANAHLSASFEHRNAFRNFTRFRIEGQLPFYFVNLGSLFDGNNADASNFHVVYGGSATVSLARPELFTHTEGRVSLQVERVPDPLIPTIASRQAARVSFGVNRTFARRWHLDLRARFTDLQYSPSTVGEASAVLTNTQILQGDPIYRDLFYDQRYAHLEQSISYDSRDDRVRPTRGMYFSATFMEGLRIPYVSDYSFLRGSVEVRGYASPTRRIVLAGRAMVGTTIGEPTRTADHAYWAVPSDLRFVSGGAQSNRGYPYGQVGLLGSVPLSPTLGTVAAADRVTALGGTSIFEASIEARWQPGAMGFVAFLDLSNVVGIDATPYVSPRGAPGAGCNPTATNAVPDGMACAMNATPHPLPVPSQLSVDTFTALFDPRQWHPSVGLGFRYLTPVGPVRIDVAVRLNDLDCTRFTNDVTTQNHATSSGWASYYLVTAPRCDFLGANFPMALHFSLGEAY